MNKLKLIIGLGFLLLIGGNLTAQTAWEVPKDKKALANPLKADPQAILAGEELFMKSCKSCHGDPGMKNMLPIQPVPTDIADKTVTSQTDGELFFKITTGRGPMPSFEKTLDENQRWSLISYIKGRGNSAPAGVVDGLSEFKMSLQYDTANKYVDAAVTGKNQNGETVAVPNAEVGVFVKRYFGDLPVGEKKKTNEKGFARIEIPTDLPGDSTGNLMLIAKLTERKYGEVNVSKEIQMGLPTIPVNILEGGHMWGTRAHAPWWIVSLYLGIAGGVWITILYIVGQILKIKKLGSKKA